MAMGKRESEHQSGLWLVTSELAQSPGRPFYERLNAVLGEAKFDTRAEELCQPFYAKPRKARSDSESAQRHAIARSEPMPSKYPTYSIRKNTPGGMPRRPVWA